MNSAKIIAFCYVKFYRFLRILISHRSVNEENRKNLKKKQMLRRIKYEGKAIKRSHGKEENKNKKTKSSKISETTDRISFLNMNGKEK